MQLDFRAIAVNIVNREEDSSLLDEIAAILEYASKSGPYTSQEKSVRKSLAKLDLLLHLLELDPQNIKKSLFENVYEIIVELALEPQPSLTGPVSMPISKPYDTDAVVMLARDILRRCHIWGDTLYWKNKELLQKYLEVLVDTFEAVFQPGCNAELCDYLTQDIDAFSDQIEDTLLIKRVFHVIHSQTVNKLSLSKIHVLATFAARITPLGARDDYDVLLDKCCDCLRTAVSKLKSGDPNALLCVKPAIGAVALVVYGYAEHNFKKKIKTALDLLSEVFSDNRLPEEIRLKAASQVFILCHNQHFERKALREFACAISKLPFSHKMRGLGRLLWMIGR